MMMQAPNLALARKGLQLHNPGSFLIQVEALVLLAGRRRREAGRDLAGIERQCLARGYPAAGLRDPAGTLAWFQALPAAWCWSDDGSLAGAASVSRMPADQASMAASHTLDADLATLSVVSRNSDIAPPACP